MGRMKENQKSDLDNKFLKEIAVQASSMHGGRHPISKEDGWKLVAAQIDGVGGINDIAGMDSSLRGPSYPPNGSQNTKSTKPFNRLASFRVVGVVLSLGLAVAVGLKMSIDNRENPPVGEQVYTTSNGEQARHTLPDGSIVFLNVGSRLEVPMDYSNGNREVKLSGEAFFTVVSHSGAPFIVRSGPSITKVLGTQFSVRYYEGDTAANILVRDGKVSVGSAVLSADQEIYVSSSGSSQVRQIASHRPDFTTGVLVLNDISIAHAIPDLNRWYDVDIRLGDASLAKRKVMGDFKTGSVSDVMSILELMFNLKIEREGKVLTLYSRE